MQRRWVKVAAGVAAFFIVVIILIPFLVKADTFRPTIEAQLSSALGRRVALGHLSFSLLKGSLVANDISIADDPAFSTSPFLGAKSLQIGVHVAPLLFSHQLRITKLTVDSPAINLIHAQSGAWNFSSFGAGAAATHSSQHPGAIPDLSVGELDITNGTATVSSLPASGAPFVYTGIDLSFQNLSLLKSFPFKLSAKLPGNGSLDLSGTAGPLAQNNADDTPFNATLNLKHFDPVAAGVIDLSKGIAMIVDIDAQLASNGTALTSSGKIQAANLQLTRTATPAPQPVNIDYSIAENLAARTGQVSDIAIHTGSVEAHVTGSFQQTVQAVVLDLHLAAPNLPVDQLVQLLPSFGVSLPKGSSLQGGTLTANLAITGPATATTITGPAEVDNTKLAGFDLGSRIQGLNPFGGKGGTEIKTLRTDMNSSPQSTQFTNIYGDLPQIGTATGSGTVLPNGTLDFKLMAKFSPASGVGMVAGKAVNAVGGLARGMFHPKGKSSDNGAIPVTVTGTTTNPSIKTNVGAMFK